MNRSSAWFEKHYPGLSSKRLMVHPATSLESAASLISPAKVLNQRELSRLKSAVRSFFSAFSSDAFADISKHDVQFRLDRNKLGVQDFLNEYGIPARNPKI